jgi:hypothetical protein
MLAGRQPSSHAAGAAAAIRHEPRITIRLGQPHSRSNGRSRSIQGAYPSRYRNAVEHHAADEHIAARSRCSAHSLDGGRTHAKRRSKATCSPVSSRRRFTDAQGRARGTRPSDGLSALRLLLADDSRAARGRSCRDSRRNALADEDRSTRARCPVAGSEGRPRSVRNACE